MNQVRTDVSRAVIQYGLALLLSIAALLIRLSMIPIVGHQTPFFLFWLATAIAVWRLGVGPAVFAAIFGAIAGDYFFVAPIHTFFAHPIEVAFVFEYLFICAVTCLLGGLTRRAHARIRAAAATALEQKERVEKEVNERKRGEAVLRSILDSAPVGIWMLDKDGYISGSNAAGDRIWGMTRPHGIYHINRCNGWWPGTGYQLAPADWPAARALDYGEAILDQEIEIETFDGKRKHALISAVPLRDKKGVVTQAISVFVDITRRKQAEDELERERSRIALLQDAAARLLSPTGTEDQLYEIYKKVGNFFGADVFLEYSTDDKFNRQLIVSGGISSDTEFRLKRLPFAEAFCQSIPERKESVFVNHIQASNDPTLQLMRSLGIRAYTCHPLLVGDRLLGTLAFASRHKDVFDTADVEVSQTVARYVAIARDRWRLTASLQAYTHDLEKAVQERTISLEESSTRLKERNYELEQLSYSIIHDLRAPLRAMRSYGQMLQEDSAHLLDATAKDYIHRIIESSQRMDQLITDVFNFTDLMREGLTLSHINPKPLLTGIVQTYPNLDPEHAEIHIAESFPNILANRGGLTQCFSNLLNNAVKFAKPGQKPIIRVWSEYREHMIRLWFEDEGIGIDPRHYERIFEMFQKLDTDSGGTGIGLALLRKAVEKMHGHVGVESEPGHGSRFWIDLEAAEIPDNHLLQPA